MLDVWLAGADGKFRNAGEKWSTGLQSGCSGLAPCSANGKPAVLVSADGPPLLMVFDKAAGWTRVDLPGEGDSVSLGQTSPCVAADLDADGYADILQPGEGGGRLWKGDGGGFARPIATPVCAGGGVGKCVPGDFNHDGSLDIFIAGTGGNSLWENDGKGGFKEVFRYSGSMSYKCPPRAADAQSMDLNHDGRTDICLVYEQGQILYHFNRGFRCFGEEGEVRLPGLEPQFGQAPQGQVAMAVADFDEASSQDLVVLTTGGELLGYMNGMYDMPGLVLRLPRGEYGPVTVSCWQGDEFKSCCGTVSVASHAPGAYVAVRYGGEVTLTWHVPGKGKKTRKVAVEDKTVEVVVE
jgi:hypothetical protein